MGKKNIPTFDFTDMDKFNDFSFFLINDKKLRKYSLSYLTGGRIMVTIVNIEGKRYRCVYNYKTKEEIYETIINEQQLDFRGIYVKDFNIEEIDNYEKYLLKDFDMSYSFLDGDISFSNSIFGGNLATFVGTNFGKGNVSFNKTNFAETAVLFNFTNFGEGEVSFERSNFSRGQVSFAGSNFGKGEVVFETVNFGEHDVSFRSVYVEDIIFIDVIFNNHIDLRFNYVKSLFVQDCIIEKTMKCNRKGYERLSFIDTVNLGQIYIDWDKNNIQKAIENCEVFYRDMYYKKQERKCTNNELVAQFRLLKENFHNIGYYDDEDKAYRAYMKYKRKSLNGTSTIVQLIKNNHKKYLIRESCKLIWNSSKKAFYALFRLVGGYGTQAWSILLTALLTIFGFGMLQYFFEWIEFTNGRAFSSKFWESMYFSGITFFTIGFGDVTPVNQLAGMMAVFEGFLGVTLMSYFVVALVRKLLR